MNLDVDAGSRIGYSHGERLARMREMKEFPEQALLQFLVGRTVGNAIFQPCSIDITLDDNSCLVVEHLLEYVGQHGSR